MGFALITLLDGGKTAIGRFRRLHPDFQGRGINKCLSTMTATTLMSMVPAVEQYMYLKLQDSPQIYPSPYGKYDTVITKV